MNISNSTLWHMVVYYQTKRSHQFDNDASISPKTKDMSEGVLVSTSLRASQLAFLKL